MFRAIRNWLIVGLVLVMLSPALYVGSYYLYRAIDQMRFPTVDTQIETLSPDDANKGSHMAGAMINQLDRELNSSFGWTPNDLYINPTRYLTRRNNRQLGVIHATRMLSNFFATNLAKYGQADNENADLKRARTELFAYSEYKWWFFSTESRYHEGIRLVRKYQSDLAAGNAVYNMRTDDIYNLLMFITGPEFLDQPLGRLIQSNDEVPRHELEERVYYAQGVTLVVRDFVEALIKLYPEVTRKGGAENIQIALKSMDRICTFDPLMVLRGDRDSLFADHRSKMARYMIEAEKRLNDLAQSIRR